MADLQNTERDVNLAQQLHSSEKKRADAEKRVSALQSALTNAIECRVLTEEEAWALDVAESVECDDRSMIGLLRGAVRRIGILPRKSSTP